MTIIIFLYAYLAFLLVIFVLSLFAVYHILRFGQQNIITLVMTFLYIAVAAIIIVLTISVITTIDWTEPVLSSRSFSSSPSFDRF